MRKVRHNLTARERFLTTNYIADHIEALREMPTNADRCKHVSEALGYPNMSIANLTTAAGAAGLALSVPRAPNSKTTPELLQRIDALEVEVAALLAEVEELSETVYFSYEWIHETTDKVEQLTIRLDALDDGGEQA